jgi:hypothetical protein
VVFKKEKPPKRRIIMTRAQLTAVGIIEKFNFEPNMSRQEAIGLIHALAKFKDPNNIKASFNFYQNTQKEIILFLMNKSNEVDIEEWDQEVRIKAREVLIRFYLPIIPHLGDYEKETHEKIIEFLAQSQKHGETKNGRDRKNVHEYLNNIGPCIFRLGQYKVDLNNKITAFKEALIVQEYFELIPKRVGLYIDMIPSLYEYLYKKFHERLNPDKKIEKLKTKKWSKKQFEKIILEPNKTDLLNIQLICTKIFYQSRYSSKKTTAEKAANALMCLVGLCFGDIVHID